jgi:hypothetical protein
VGASEATELATVGDEHSMQVSVAGNPRRLQGFPHSGPPGLTGFPPTPDAPTMHFVGAQALVRKLTVDVDSQAVR